MTIEQILTDKLFSKSQLCQRIYPDRPKELLTWKTLQVNRQKITEEDRHLIRNYFKTNFNIDVK